MTLLQASLKEQNGDKRTEQFTHILEKFDKTCEYLEKIANRDIIPKYRSIVGKTVADLSRPKKEKK